MTCATIVTTCTQRLKVYAGRHKYIYIYISIYYGPSSSGCGEGGGEATGDLVTLTIIKVPLQNHYDQHRHSCLERKNVG